VLVLVLVLAPVWVCRLVVVAPVVLVLATVWVFRLVVLAPVVLLVLVVAPVVLLVLVLAPVWGLVPVLVVVVVAPVVVLTPRSEVLANRRSFTRSCPVGCTVVPSKVVRLRRTCRIRWWIMRARLTRESPRSPRHP
jgi:hypothetical protein